METRRSFSPNTPPEELFEIASDLNQSFVAMREENERLRTQLKDAQLPTAADVRGIMAPDDQMNDDADYWMEKTESALKRAGNYQIALAIAEMHIARASGGGETDLRARLQHVINTGEPMPEAGQTTDTSKWR